MSRSFRINEPDVIYQLFDGEVVAIHLGDGAYHSLPAVAGDAFIALGSAGAPIDDVAARIAEKYDAPVDSIARDLSSFFSQLEQQRLIVPVSNGTAHPPGPRQAAQAARAPYAKPSVQSHLELQELFLIDPVHDVGRGGWPNLPADSDLLATAAFPAVRCRLAGQHVIFERFEEETVAMNLSSGAYHSLSGPGQDVFLLLTHDPTTFELRDALASKYAASRSELEESLREFLAELVEAGLIAIDTVAGEAATRELPLDIPGTGLPFSPPALAAYREPYLVGNDAAPLSQPGTARRYRLRPGDFLFASAGGETVLIDRDLGSYFRLNRPAADLFGLLSRESAVEDLVAALERKYQASRHEFVGAVMILLLNLMRSNLVVSAAGEPPQPLPAAPPAESRAPFPGFEILLYSDLEDLARPFNVITPSPRPPDSRGRQFAAMLQDYFAQVAANVPDRGFTVASRSIRVRRAGDWGADLTRALAHLASDPSTTPDLTIHVWDYATPPADALLASTLAALRSDWPAVCGPRGELRNFDCAAIRAIFHPGPDTLSVIDTENGRAYFLKLSDSPLPYWELGSPFRHIFHVWFGSRNLQYVHGGAVGLPSAGVFLAGKGGSGKSTTALAAACAGFLYAGDDYCLVDCATGFVHGLYNTGKLKAPADLERLPILRGRSFNADSFERGGPGKAVFSISDVWPDRVAAGFPLRAILIPNVIGEPESRIEEASAADALIALAPSTVAQLPASGDADCARIGELAGNVPAYFLRLGTDLSRVPPLLRGLLE